MKTIKSVGWRVICQLGLGAKTERVFSYEKPVSLKECKDKLMEFGHGYIVENAISFKPIGIRIYK